MDSSQADAVLTSLQARLDAVDKKISNPKIDIAGAAQALATVTGVQAKLDDLDEKKAQALITADDEAANATLDDLRLKLDILKAQRNDIEIGADATRAELDMALLKAELDDLQRTREINIDASGLDKARSSALALGITLAATSLGPLVALAAGAGLVAAGFGAAALTGGGFATVTERLLGDLMSGAMGASGFGQALDSVGSGAMQDFSNAAGAAGDAVGHIFVAIAPLIEKADGFILEIAEDFDKWAKSVGGSEIDSFFTKLFGSVNMGEVKSDLADIVTIVGNIVKAEENMSGFSFGGLSVVLDVLAHLNPTVIEALTVLFAVIKTIGAISGLVDFAKSFIGQIGNIKDALVDFFTEEVDEGGSAGDATGAAYTGAFKGALAGLPEAVTAALASLGQGGGEAEAAGAAAAEAFVGGFEGGLAGMADAATGAVSSLDAVTGDAEAAGAAAGAALVSGFAGGIEELPGVLSGAVASLADGADEAEGIGTATGEALVGGFGEALGELEGVMAEAVGSVAEIAAEGGNAAGIAMGEGMVAGLAEIAPAVEAEAAEIAAVAGAAIKAALIIASPSQVTRQLGQFTGLGFALGMRDTHGDVAGAATSLAQLPARMTAGVSAGVSGGGSGGGTATVQLEVSGGGSGAFEQFMQTAIKNWVRVKGGGSVQRAFGYGSG